MEKKNESPKKPIIGITKIKKQIGVAIPDGELQHVVGGGSRPIVVHNDNMHT
jgi:hypothetical protein